MGLKEGLILALIYLIPFALLMPPDSANSPGAVFLWFLWPIVGGILLLVTAIVAWKFFDIDFIPWGLTIWLGLPILTLATIPIFTLVWSFYIVPPLGLLLIGLTQG